MNDKRTMSEWLQDPVDPKIKELAELKAKQIKEDEERKKRDKKKKDDDELLLILACSFCG